MKKIAEAQNHLDYVANNPIGNMIGGAISTQFNKALIHNKSNCTGKWYAYSKYDPIKCATLIQSDCDKDGTGYIPCTTGTMVVYLNNKGAGYDVDPNCRYEFYGDWMKKVS